MVIVDWINRLIGVSLCALGLLVLGSVPAGADSFTLTIDGGRVTLVATDASIRDILTAWADLGGTQVVGADELSGPLVSVDLREVSEAAALRTLLRSAAGYVAAPRREGSEGRSQFDRILILATSRSSSSPRVAAVSPSPPSVQGAPGPPRVISPQVEDPLAELQRLDDSQMLDEIRDLQRLLQGGAPPPVPPATIGGFGSIASPGGSSQSLSPTPGTVIQSPSGAGAIGSPFEALGLPDLSEAPPPPSVPNRR